MGKRITVVISQGQSANPDKRGLEEALVGALLTEPGVEVVVIPHLYDLSAGSTGMLCLEGITGDVIVLSWLYPRAAHWTLDRHGIRGHFGETLLKSEADDEDDEHDEEPEASAEDQQIAADDKQRVGPRDLPDRKIYHLHLVLFKQAGPYIEEIRRIQAEASVQTVSLMGWIQGDPKPAQLERYLQPGPGNVGGNGSFGPAVPPDASGTLTINGAAGGAASSAGDTSSGEAQAREPARVDETPARRWYPVIDYSRCTNCMECIDFCLFGVYGVDGAETILVEQPDNCRKGCPACSRVCPENAIIFPQHKTPAIAGSPEGIAGGLKIDLSQLFGAPSAIEIAAQERDTELVAVGREAVGLSVGIPKRQAGKEQGPKDDLDKLMDQLDDLDL
jgi:NAD-dependent dihydropyrimidine dehydrogenase PreA subunit